MAQCATLHNPVQTENFMSIKTTEASALQSWFLQGQWPSYTTICTLLCWCTTIRCYPFTWPKSCTRLKWPWPTSTFQQHSFKCLFLFLGTGFLHTSNFFNTCFFQDQLRGWFFFSNGMVQAGIRKCGCCQRRVLVEEGVPHTLDGRWVCVPVFGQFDNLNAGTCAQVLQPFADILCWVLCHADDLAPAVHCTQRQHAEIWVNVTIRTYTPVSEKKRQKDRQRSKDREAERQRSKDREANRQAEEQRQRGRKTGRGTKTEKHSLVSEKNRQKERHRSKDRAALFGLWEKETEKQA